MIHKYQAKRLYSLTEVANILKISRVAVFNKIQRGELKAHKIGNNYVIDGVDILFENNLPAFVKNDIEEVVKRAIKEYGEAFKRLGKE